ncbi:hypothetical protein FRC11_014691, partial [Ceratobasidium sp. 423]
MQDLFQIGKYGGHCDATITIVHNTIDLGSHFTLALFAALLSHPPPASSFPPLSAALLHTIPSITFF